MQILEAAHHLPVLDTQMEEVEKALGYFEVNRERMRYAHFRELGIFVASGAVEAGCRAVVAQRLKLSGMRWSVRSAACQPEPAGRAGRRPAAAGMRSGSGSPPRPQWRDRLTYFLVSHPNSRIERSILVIVWHLLSDPNARFVDLGTDFYERRVNKDRRTRDLVRQLLALGHEVTLTPAAA